MTQPVVEAFGPAASQVAVGPPGRQSRPEIQAADCAVLAHCQHVADLLVPQVEFAGFLV